MQNFSEQIQGADVALFYYAGHGVQVSGSNYLVPVGANPTREADVDFQMVDVNLVLRQMQGSGTRLNMVILDACRNNPFGARSLRAAEGGLAQMRAPEGTLISYATQPGSVAQDGADGNSPYTKALSATVRQAGLDIFQTFNQVGLAVKRATAGAQQPWVSSSPISGNFLFRGRARQRDRHAAVGRPLCVRQRSLAQHEVINTLAAFQDHLARFPNRAFAGLSARADRSLEQGCGREEGGDIHPSRRSGARNSSAKVWLRATPTTSASTRGSPSSSGIPTSRSNRSIIRPERWNPFPNSEHPARL